MRTLAILALSGALFAADPPLPPWDGMPDYEFGPERRLLLSGEHVSTEAPSGPVPARWYALWAVTILGDETCQTYWIGHQQSDGRFSPAGAERCAELVDWGVEADFELGTVTYRIDEYSTTFFAIEAERYQVPHGDANSDGAVDISDALAILGALFREPRPLCSADVNRDGYVDVSDGISVLLGLFQEDTFGLGECDWSDCEASGGTTCSSS